MNAIRQFVRPQNGKLWIDIPKEMTNQTFEVIVFPVEDSFEKEELQTKIKNFLNTLPSDEPTISEAEILAEVKSVRSKRYE